MVKIQHFRLWLILNLHKIMIFGAKIQIIQVKLFKNNSFLNSKIQFHIFEFFWKLDIWTQFEIF